MLSLVSELSPSSRCVRTTVSRATGSGDVMSSGGWGVGIGSSWIRRGIEFLLRTTHWRLRRGVGMSSFDNCAECGSSRERLALGRGAANVRESLGTGMYGLGIIVSAMHSMILIRLANSVPWRTVPRTCWMAARRAARAERSCFKDGGRWRRMVL